MEKEYNIYTLTCPTTNNIFYVGRTNGKLKNRLNGHLKDNINREKKKVINEILEKDKLPIIESIDLCTKSDVYKLEIFWINLIKTWVFNLTNLVHINQSYHKSKLYLKTKIEYAQHISNRPSENHVYSSISKKIKITEENEAKLIFIKTLGIVNKIDVSSKEKLINFSIKVAYDCAKSLDDDSLEALCNLKKSL